MTDIDRPIESLLQTVLNDCVKHVGNGSHKALLEHLQQGNGGTQRFLYHRMGQEIARFLGTWDEDIKAVYLFDYANAAGDGGCDAAFPIAPIHLIVWTCRKTAALQALISVLDHGLVKGIAALCHAGRMGHLLDTQIVDDTDINDHTGYGALLFSLGLAPTQVWERAEKPSEETERSNPTSPSNSLGH